MTEKKITQKECYETGNVFALLFILISLVAKSPVYCYVSVVFLLVSLLKPGVFKPLAFVWFEFSKILGKISSFVILTVIYLVVVLPVSMFIAMKGSDPLNIKHFKKFNGSGFVDRNHVYIADDLKKPY
jgi:hypothetical protein